MILFQQLTAKLIYYFKKSKQFLDLL
jgi:hypothetical protein